MARPPKNIVVFCDGTGNRYAYENSNVVKLYTCIQEREGLSELEDKQRLFEIEKNGLSEIEAKKGQSAYYHPGVGTMGDPRKTGAIGKKISLIKGLAFGSGFMQNLSDAYRYLMNEYADGDHIYIFGFSRGAYTARALAGAIYMYGLLCPGNEGHLAYLLDMFSRESHEAYYSREYEKGETKVFREGDISMGFRDTFSRVAPIHFLGVWDTVSSLGFTNPIRLLFDGQNPVVRRVRHAVSVDERRCFFQANLLGKPLEASKTPVLTESYPVDKYPNPADRTQNIVQAWFAGVHSDVGGSYCQSQCGPAMDALQWMFEEAVADGLIHHPGKTDAIFGRHPSGHDALDAMNTPPKPLNNMLHNSLTVLWWPLEAFPHEYFDQNGKRDFRYLPWPHRRELPEGALIHPSLRHRLLTDKGYQPKNLLRADIVDFDGSSDDIPQAEVLQQLKSDGYGVYRPKSVAKPVPARAAAGVAAAVILGLASWLLRR